eukprot:scaffold147054_cov17-Prasinocladus_malaysianus.AAC.1
MPRALSKRLRSLIDTHESICSSFTLSEFSVPFAARVFTRQKMKPQRPPYITIKGLLLEISSMSAI